VTSTAADSARRSAPLDDVIPFDRVSAKVSTRVSTRTLSEALRLCGGARRRCFALMSGGIDALGNLAGGVICCPPGRCHSPTTVCVHTGQRDLYDRARIAAYRKIGHNRACFGGV